MSVINKMLRDLDARQTAQGKPAQPDVALPGAGLSRLSPQGVFARRGARLLAALLLLLAAGAAAWYYQQSAVSPSPAIPAAAVAPRPVAVPVVSPTPVPVALPASEAVAAAPAPAPAPAPKASAPAVSSPQSAVKTALAPAVTSPSVSAQGRLSTPASQARAASAPSSAAQSRARAAASSPAVAAPAASGGAVATVSADALARETLGQARHLWGQGARAGALSLLREALPAREASPAVRADLLGELARMELAEGRAAQALALLARLDGDLAQQADLWALRGNAAQRLARHQEAAESYQTALGLRPTETRWMLAAAVSLAALGHLEQAAVWAERARAAGNANPDVLGYLRQVGVPLRGGH